MAAIKYYDLTRLKKFGLLEYSESFMALATACQTVTTKMQRTYNPLVASYNVMMEISQRVDKSDLTDPIHLLDSQQDGIYTAMWHAVNSLRKSTGETGEKATSLWNTMNSKRVHTNIQYLQELAEVDRLIAVLDRDQAENIEALGLKPLYDRLKSINAEIHRLVDERNDENLEKPDGKFSAARAVFTSYYDAFVYFVNAYQLINVEDAEQPDEALDLFIRKANNLIKLYEDTQRPTSGGSAGSTEETETEETETEETETEETETEEEETEGNENEGKKKIEYVYNGNIVATQWYNVGERVVEPEGLLPEGWIWGNTPNVMPDRDITVTAVEDE